MFISIFKNVLLIFILILILHFLIKNKLSDTTSSVKRQLIIKEALKGSYYKKPLLVNKNDSIVDSSIEEIEVSDVQKDDLYSVSDSGSGLISEDIVENELLKKKDNKDDKCKTLPCEAFLEKKPVDEKDSKIKALYDFVFSEEKGETEGDSLNKYFPNNVVDQVKHDATEIDKHYNNVELDEKASNYKYEVIGNIKEEDVDGIAGIDTMGLSNYSNL